MIQTWPEMKAFALSLGLPQVEETKSWGNEVLKAHGKLWVWWSPYVEAALFKCDIEERDTLRMADPDTFLHHSHYEKHGLLLVAAGRIEPDWAKARLTSTWRTLAPKKFLMTYDAERT